MLWAQLLLFSLDLSSDGMSMDYITSSVLLSADQTERCKIDASKLRKNCEKCSPCHYFLHDNNMTLRSEDIQAAFVRAGLSKAQVEHNSTRNCHVIQLCRAEAVLWILTRFHSSRLTARTDKPAQRMIFNLPSVYLSPGSRLDSLRALVLAQHVLRLQQREASTLSPMIVGTPDADIDRIIRDVSETAPTVAALDDSQLRALLGNCARAKMSADQQSWTVSLDGDKTVEGNTITQYQLVTGSAVYSQLARVVAALSVNPSEQQNEDIHVYHLISASSSYSHQLMLELLGVILPQNDRAVHHHTVLIGAVKLSPSGDVSEAVKAYIDDRRSYLLSSSEERYGAEVYETGFWSERISSLTLSAVRFELLSRQPSQPLTLKIGSGYDDTRAGSFVLYNCSRLSTLFQNFEERVKQGYYPSLPNFDEVDFGLLKAQDEWNLVFHYLNTYPLLVFEVTSHTRDPKRANSSLSRIATFMHRLSREFSTYYSRTHVLGEPKPHLIPTMMSRLWLLRLIYRVFKDGLSLLAMETFSSM